MPFGIFVALAPRRASPLVRTGVALAAGLTLSFSMETLQMFLPPRDASLVDLVANTLGAVVGGLLGGDAGARGAHAPALSGARAQSFLAGKLGDIGLALLALWLTAQINPGIPLFAVTFEPGLRGCGRCAAPGHRRDDARGRAIRVPARGVGLFLALLLRERRYIGGAVLLLIGVAFVLKGLPHGCCSSPPPGRRG